MDGYSITVWSFLILGIIVVLFGIIEAIKYFLRPIPIFSEKVQSHLFDPGESCYQQNGRNKKRFAIPGNYKRYFLICYEPDPQKPDFRCQYIDGTIRKDIGGGKSMEQAVLICKHYKPQQ